MRTAAVLILLISVCIGVYYYMCLGTKDDLERLTPPEWANFGRLSDENAKQDAANLPRPFKVEFTDSDVEDFKLRLKNARLPPAKDPSVNMTFGFPSSDLPNLRDELLNLDWNSWQKAINQYEQYMVSIRGLWIHYVRIKGTPGLRSVPLLLVHGWPGSFYEFYRAVPHLLSEAEAQGFTYDIIIPSLPGFGYSEAPYKTGCDARQVAAIFHELMTVRLEMRRYICQAGDFGVAVVEWITSLFPDHIMGLHVNMFIQNKGIIVSLNTVLYNLFPTWLLSAEEAERVLDVHTMSPLYWMIQETGYMHIQSTKPDTLGAGLTDSPLGLAAYIIEKFYTWTNASTVSLPVDEATDLLPFDIRQAYYNILIYWHANCIGTSVRFYKESGMFSDYLSGKYPFSQTNVPTGVLMTRNELSFSPEHVVRWKYTNLKQYSLIPIGGHFAAFEIPEEFSKVVANFTAVILSEVDAGK